MMWSQGISLPQSVLTSWSFSGVVFSFLRGQLKFLLFGDTHRHSICLEGAVVIQTGRPKSLNSQTSGRNQETINDKETPNAMMGNRDTKKSNKQSVQGPKG